MYAYFLKLSNYVSLWRKSGRYFSAVETDPNRGAGAWVVILVCPLTLPASAALQDYAETSKKAS
jgi:hypothetical protein